MLRKILSLALALIMALGVLSTPGLAASLQQAAEPSSPAPSLAAAAIDSGVKLEWTPLSGVLGYRLYRSTQQDGESVSLTEFPVTGSSYVDVQVDANTTYYYTVCSVVREANITGQREEHGSPSAQIKVTTGAEILGGNASASGDKTKNVILMKLNDTKMSVNGMRQGIDPGRDTAPQVLNDRAIVPIRAIIEAMGGKLGWEEATGKISLEAGSHSVAMWLNQHELVVDGQNKTMDVAPVAINGRTMVPLRFAAENLGCVVEWLPASSEILMVYFTPGVKNPDRLTAGIMQSLNSGTFHIVLKGLSGDLADVEVEIFVDNKMMALLMKVWDVGVRLVNRDGKSYTIIDELKQVMIENASEGEGAPSFVGAKNLTYVGSGTGSFNGKTYNYDQYSGAKGEQFFYFMEGGSLKGVRTISEGKTEEAEILAFDQSISATVFEIPADYTVEEKGEKSGLSVKAPKPDENMVLLHSATAKFTDEMTECVFRLYGEMGSAGSYVGMILQIEDVENGQNLWEMSFAAEGDLDGAHLLLDDANFDGATDVMISVGPLGAHGHLSYGLLLWDEASNGLQSPHADFWGILNPVIDYEDKVIRSLAANSAFEDYYRIYSYADGAYRLDLELILTYSEENGKETFTFQPYQYFDGIPQPQSVFSTSEAPDPNHPDQKAYFGEDSIWKLADAIWYDSPHFKGVVEDAPPEDGYYSGVVLAGQFYHDGRAEWISYLYTDVGRTQYGILLDELGEVETLAQSTEIQIYTTDAGIQLEDYVGQRIRFKGEHFLTETVYHRRDIVFEITEIAGE